MRASTIFALIIAVLLGLGAAVFVRASGILSPREAKKEPVSPQLLVAATNLFEGNYLQVSDVKLRPARNAEELKLLKDSQLLPPLPQAAVKRVPRVNIPADTPIRHDMLEDMNPPLEITNRLLPGTRAVTVAVLKEHSAGCLIKPGDMVDVELMTTIENEDGSTSRGCTASIARNALVVAKRNSLYPMPGSVSGPCPCNYTLAVNPYRAALIEFAKDKGIIALHPISEGDKREYEASLRPRGDGIVTVSWSIPDSPEYADEDRKVAEYLSGNRVISEKDLFRLCGVNAVPHERAPEPTRIMKFTARTYVGDHVFDAAGSPTGFVGVGGARGGAPDPAGGAQYRNQGPTPDNYIPGGRLPGGAARSGTIGLSRGLSAAGASDLRVGVFDGSARDGRVTLASNQDAAASFRFRPPESSTSARANVPRRNCPSCQQR